MEISLLPNTKGGAGHRGHWLRVGLLLILVALHLDFDDNADDEEDEEDEEEEEEEARRKDKEQSKCIQQGYSFLLLLF